MFDDSEAGARALDASDPLSDYRDRFLIPRNGQNAPLIYFAGHSLGLQPRSVRSAIDSELERWAALGVEGHFAGDTPWLSQGPVLSGVMGPLVGAHPDEVVLMNALTVNLHHLLASFYRPTRERYKVLVEHRPFPSDRYAVESQCALHGYDPDQAVVELQPRPGESTLRTDDIVRVLRERGEGIALVLLGGINYYTGQLFDLERITQESHGAGCTVGFDLAHAAGNVELELHQWGVDFAVWCTYKYLNAGPGSVAGCFIHRRHFDTSGLTRLAGWWGEDVQKRFRMSGPFEPSRGAAGWQISNPDVLSLAALRASLAIFSDAGPSRVFHKQRRLTGYLEALIRSRLADRVDVVTPSDPRARGSQLSLRIPDRSQSVVNDLRDAGVICDWRNPDIIRVAPAPLYNRFLEVWEFVDLLARL